VPPWAGPWAGAEPGAGSGPGPPNPRPKPLPSPLSQLVPAAVPAAAAVSAAAVWAVADGREVAAAARPGKENAGWGEGNAGKDTPAPHTPAPPPQPEGCVLESEAARRQRLAGVLVWPPQGGAGGGSRMVSGGGSGGGGGGGGRRLHVKFHRVSLGTGRADLLRSDAAAEAGGSVDGKVAAVTVAAAGVKRRHPDGSGDGNGDGDGGGGGANGAGTGAATEPKKAKLFHGKVGEEAAPLPRWPSVEDVGAARGVLDADLRRCRSSPAVMGLSLMAGPTPTASC
jgi:hypothetical protein